MNSRSRIVASVLAGCILLAARPSTAFADDAIVNAGSSGGDTVITGSVVIKADQTAVWQVLTDYDKLATFVPPLGSSRLLRAENDSTFLIEQTSIGQFAFFKRTSRARFISHHDREYGRIRTTFQEGDFHRHETEWRLEAQGHATRLHYRAVIRSVHKAPQWIVNRIAHKAVVQTLDALRDETLRRMPLPPSDPD